MENIDKNTWKKHFEQPEGKVILDVRTLEEVEEGIIPGAQHIDVLNPQDFMQQAQQLDPQKSYYVYCRSGARSMQACAVLQQFGINNTFNLQGGFMEWDGEVGKL